MEVRVNGVRRRLEVDPRTTLLDALREHLYLTGTKKGCDHGQCGALTVMVGGRALLSCLTLLASVRAPVMTIEGLGDKSETSGEDGALHPVQQACIDQDALQCGYCTPGQVLTAVGCRAEGHAGSDSEIREYMAFGAIMVVVRVHRRNRQIRCPRAAGAFAAGRIINQKAAESQLIGGIIWGILAVLHEVTEVDPGAARYCNTDLCEYLIPVNADIGDVQVLTLDEEDREVNPPGIKGIGELGNVGTNAAVANAVHHATGICVRKLPIRIENLL